MSSVVLPFAPPRDACRVCGSSRLRLLETLRRGHGMWECTGCGVWSVLPQPSRARLENLYDKDYYVPWRGESRVRERMWRRRLRLLKTAPRGPLLDVGCAEGAFLELAADEGFEVRGTEISRHAALETERRLGVPVFCGELHEAGFDAGRFAVVTVWHVLEHVFDPGLLLTDAFRILRPGGWLVVAVPNRRNTVYRALYRLARRRPLHLYDPSDREQHIHHWDPDSLKAGLAGHGFHVREIRPDPCALGFAKRAVDALGRLHSWMAGAPRTQAMVALAVKPPEGPPC